MYKPGAIRGLYPLRRLSLNSTDEDVVRQFHKAVGVGTFTGPYQPSQHRKPIWYWKLSAWTHLEELLKAFTPCLGARRAGKARKLLADPSLQPHASSHPLPIFPTLNPADLETLVAWAAGVFEGEGTIEHYRRGTSTERGLTIAMTDEDVVRKFRSVVNCGEVSGPRDQGPGNKPIWKWRVRRHKDLTSVLDSFLPYLGERRHQRAVLLKNDPAPPIGQWNRKEKCKRGHSLSDPETVSIRANGERRCLLCNREREQQRSGR